MSENAGPEDEAVHATINADPVAAAAGDGSEPQPDVPVEDPYDVPNEDEVDPDPNDLPEGATPQPRPEYTDVQDDGSVPS